MSEQLKQHQPSMTINEQISNLKEKGLVIKNEDYARNILSDISYFRLIKAYSLGLKEKNGKYYEGIEFEHIVALYLFNANLRQILFPQVERIEVNARCRISNYVSEKYGVMGYLNKENFADEEYYNQFMDDVASELSRNARAPFVKNYRENYDGGQLPFYALVEICSFGTLSKFYKNMKNEDKKLIAKSYNVGYTYFESWLESISYVRNICAHYGRLYNAIIVKKPMIYKQYADMNISNNRLFSVLLCMRELLKGSDQWNAFVDELDMLTKKYDKINIYSMGFVDNWQEMLKS
ncbi:MAG: Abi family protein [Lachnospiraceae bacterium]|nr:Abi family protein [Lachnospiraceae bacterium]